MFFGYTVAFPESKLFSIIISLICTIETSEIAVMRKLRKINAKLSLFKLLRLKHEH